MQRIKNIYADGLEAFTFDEMLVALQAISQETQRLDFKRLNVGRPALAHLCCAFANADGGIIAIGFDDPVAGKPVALLDLVDISDTAKTALAAAINARAQPPLPIELFGYSSSDGQSFLVIRVDQSETAPHEYIGNDFSNLPVRRDTQTGTLRLSEIDALRARSDSSPEDSPLGQKQPVIFIGQHSTTADISIGIRITPAFYSRDRLILDTDDNQELADIVNRSRGTHGSFFGHLTGHTYLDGYIFTRALTPGGRTTV
jgi:hypothetical protein